MNRYHRCAVYLECLNIDYGYPGAPIPVLRNLNLRMNEPGFHALFGPSGVGKTTLARLFTGDIHTASGEMRTEGVDTILYCHNQEKLPGWSSVGRHLERITPGGKTALKDALVTEFGLPHLLSQRFDQLSLGQQNRINLLRYLVQPFQMLIMDESLANVDEQTRERIVLAIKETFPHAMFLYISHNVVEVARYCRGIWVLRGAGKTPQAVHIHGQDARQAVQMNPQALQQTMLEMVNAA